MTRITIKIIDTPNEAAIIAADLRRFLLRNTPALVWDNCGCGTTEQPRRLEAAFTGVRRGKREAR